MESEKSPIQNPERGPEIDVVYTGSGPNPRDPAPVGDVFAETADKVFGRAQLKVDLETQKELHDAVKRLRIPQTGETRQERLQRQKDLALRERLYDGLSARLAQHTEVSDQ